jgi:hypothetical protein
MVRLLKTMVPTSADNSAVYIRTGPVLCGFAAEVSLLYVSCVMRRLVSGQLWCMDVPRLMRE